MMKKYVITGATSGIGEALTKHFSKENIVFAGYRNEEKLDNLKKISDNIIPFYVDYAKPETIAGAIDNIKQKTDKVDTLINVAGCVVAGATECISVSELRRQFDVNVFGAFELSQGLNPLLENGRIINISSMASYGIFPFISPYCASKRALDILFNAFSLENKRNIKVVSIKPGVIATPLWSKSVKENTETMDKCTDYKDESEYIVQNAFKNEKHGLNVQKVVNAVVKADRVKNPKPSYCVGFDSWAASVASKLPQTLLNKIIKSKVKKLGVKG